MRVLGIDPATVSGWALIDTDEPSNNASGVEKISLRKGESTGMKFIRYENWVLGLLKKYSPDYLTYESPVQGEFTATRSHSNLEACIIVVAEKYKEEFNSNFDYGPFSPSTVKGFARKMMPLEGKGMYSKAKMKESARLFFGIDIIDDNHADALWLAQCFIGTYLT